MANVKSQILNPITGRAKYNFLDDGTLCDAITGKTVGVIVGDQLISTITGEAMASVVSDNNGNIDLSFITAGAEDILKGKVGADVNGNPVEGVLEVSAGGGGEAAIYQCSDVTVEPTEGIEADFPLNAIPIEGEIAGQIKTTSNVISNSTVSTIDGIQGITFGAGDYVAMNATKDDSNSSWYRDSTVSFWIVPTNAANAFIFTAAQQWKTSGYYYSAGYRLQNGSFFGNQLEIGKLQHICMVHNNYSAKGDKGFYINGKRINNSFAFNDGGLGTHIVIHGYHSGSNIVGDTNEIFMSDFRVFNRPLSEKEVETLYRASIGENVKAWAGYKANRVEDYYELSDTVTSGLTYTRMIPEVGKIYDAEATFEVAKLQEPPPPPGSLKVSGFPEPFYVPMGQINNPNGLWTPGRWGWDTGFVADPTATGTDRAWLSPDGAALLYNAGGWYIDSIGAVQMGMGVYPNPQLDNPYRDDGSSCEWYSMGELVNGGSITLAG